MRRFPTTALVCALLFSVSALTQAGSANVTKKSGNLPDSSVKADVPTSLDNSSPTNFVLAFQPGLSQSNASKLIRGAGGQVLKEITSVFSGAVASGPRAKILALAKNPNFRFVEEDAEIFLDATQSSPPSWGLDRIDQVNLPLSGGYEFEVKNDQGSGITAYVVDTGIDASRSDISARVLSGFTSIADKYGTTDCNGHGTHVAGTIGGTKYGVAKQVNLVPVRVFSCTGSGSTSGVILGLDWIGQSANATSGKVVVNMSLGGTASTALDDAVRGLISKGVPVVVAAGNNNGDACNYSPARVAEAITVGATDISDRRASYSNYGKCVDIFAPGTNITSLWIGSAATKTRSGTSMATPHVVGAIARYLTNANKVLSPQEIVVVLNTSSTLNKITDTRGAPNSLLLVPFK